MQCQRGRRDPLALGGVDTISLDSALHGRVTDVLVADAAHEIEQQPFAKRHLRDVEMLDVERIEGGREHRDPARKHGTAVVLQLPEPDRIDVPGPDQLAPQAAQRASIDAVLAPAGRARDRRDRLDRARAADRGAPAGVAVQPFDRLELHAGREQRALHRMPVDPALGKEPPAGADAADVQAFPVQGSESASDDTFRAAAADVDDQTSFAVVGERVSHAQIDEPGLLAARDDVDGVPPARAAPRAGMLRRCGRCAGYWCRPRVPPARACRAASARTGEDTRAHVRSHRGAGACDHPVPPRAAPARAVDPLRRDDRRPPAR